MQFAKKSESKNFDQNHWIPPRLRVIYYFLYKEVFYIPTVALDLGISLDSEIPAAYNINLKDNINFVSRLVFYSKKIMPVV